MKEFRCTSNVAAPASPVPEHSLEPAHIGHRQSFDVIQRVLAQPPPSREFLSEQQMSNAKIPCVGGSFGAFTVSGPTAMPPKFLRVFGTALPSRDTGRVRRKRVRQGQVFDDVIEQRQSLLPESGEQEGKRRTFPEVFCLIGAMKIRRRGARPETMRLPDPVAGAGAAPAKPNRWTRRS
jgi:hypothetical protein